MKEVNGQAPKKVPGDLVKRRKPRVAVPNAYHHGDLRNALLREGRGLLEEQGPSELSLREVARRAGVSEAAPSRHFEGKEGLLASIAAEGFGELLAQRLAIQAARKSTLEAAREMMLSYVRYAQANRGVFNLMVGPRIIDNQRFADLADVAPRSFRVFADTIVELALECGWPRRQLELVAHSAWAIEHGLATLVLAGRAPSANSQIDLDQMLDFAIAMMLSAITAGPGALKQVRK